MTALLTKRYQMWFKRRAYHLFDDLHPQRRNKKTVCSIKAVLWKLWKAGQQEVQIFKLIHPWIVALWLTRLCVSVCQGSDEISSASDQVIRITVCHPWLALPSLVSCCSNSPAVLLVMDVEAYSNGKETATLGFMSATNVFFMYSVPPSAYLPLLLPGKFLPGKRELFLSLLVARGSGSDFQKKHTDINKGKTQ